jgi:hypothetical protein
MKIDMDILTQMKKYTIVNANMKIDVDISTLKCKNIQMSMQT